MRVDDECYVSAPVLAFAVEMQAKLDENCHKGDSWRDMTSAQLLKRLEQEVAELKRAVKKARATKKKGDDRTAKLSELRKRSSVDDEAADVANFCAFIAEKFGDGGFHYSDD